MQELAIYREELRIGRFAVQGRPVEVGRALGCDIVVDDPGLAPRHWLLSEQGGTLWAFDLAGSRGGRARRRPVPIGVPFRLGARHHLLRRSPAEAEGPTPRSGDTVSRPPSGEGESLVLVVGEGPEARRYVLDERPLNVGRGPHNDVVIADPGVSQQHCRLEPHTGGGRLLRDLDSRNGTQVGGVRVQRALLGPGSAIRIGGTALRIGVRASARSEAADGMVVASHAMREVMARARAAAPLPWPLLIHGESGSGKEGVAAAVHRHGDRRDGPFVALNAGGLSEPLVESELFGHERGAFTGAEAVRRGVFEQADGGTLFLDEIGELPLSLQARLLRVLETGEVRRVGAERARRVDVRLVCATHRDLRALAERGEFRADLYYRVARLIVPVPPLRSRPADVRALAEHFMREIAAELGPRTLSEQARDRLLLHTWPGNARELRNVLCTAVVACPGDRIEAADVEAALVQVSGASGAEPPPVENLRAVVAAHRGNLSAAARALGLPRSTLRDRLRTAPPEGAAVTLPAPAQPLAGTPHAQR